MYVCTRYAYITMYLLLCTIIIYYIITGVIYYYVSTITIEVITIILLLIEVGTLIRISFKVTLSKTCGQVKQAANGYYSVYRPGPNKY